MWSAQAAGGHLLHITHRLLNATLLPMDAPRLATERITRAARMTNTAFQRSGLSTDVPRRNTPSRLGGITKCCSMTVLVLQYISCILSYTFFFLSCPLARNAFACCFSAALAGELETNSGRSQPEKECSGSVPHENLRQPISRHLASVEWNPTCSAFYSNHQPDPSYYDEYTLIYCRYTNGTNMRSETLDEAPHRNRCYETASACSFQAVHSHLTMACYRLMSDYEVTLVNDNMREFYVRFHGPPESELFRVLATRVNNHILQLRLQAEYGRYTLSCKLIIHINLLVSDS